MPPARRSSLLFAAAILLISVPPATAQNPAATLSLSQERAAAKAAGLELSSAALSPPMPPASENAAPFYKKLGDEANAKARAEIERMVGDSKPARGQTEAQLLEKASHYPNTLTRIEWNRVRTILASRRAFIEAIRNATRKTKFVLVSKEYVPVLQDEIVSRYLFPTGASMREAVRTLVSESAWEAYDGHPNDAIRDLVLCMRMAHQLGSYSTTLGYIMADAIYSAAIGGFKVVLRMYSRDPTVCRAVQTALSENSSRPPLSDALRIDLAVEQDTVDQFMQAGPESLNIGKGTLSKENFGQFLDKYGADQLRSMREAISIVDMPSATSGPMLSRISAEIEKKYPDSGILPSSYRGSPYLPFHRDMMSNAVQIALTGATVLIYHAMHHTYPKTLAEAMPAPPADAFDGKPLHYEVTATGFVISATHQRPDNKPETAQFRYPLAAH